MIHLAPTANVAEREFHEADRAVEFRLPLVRADLPLASIDLHKRAGANQWIERIVLEADIAVYGFVQIEMLQEANGNLLPFLHDLRKQIRFR